MLRNVHADLPQEFLIVRALLVRELRVRECVEPRDELVRTGAVNILELTEVTSEVIEDDLRLGVDYVGRHRSY